MKRNMNPVKDAEKAAHKEWRPPGIEVPSAGLSDIGVGARLC